MKFRNYLAPAILGTALIAGSALAQPPGGGGGGRPGGGFGGGFGMPGGFGGAMSMMLGQNKQLQEELKLDKDQIDKINEALGKVRDSARDEFSKFADATPEERTEMIKKMMETNTKAVESALKPEQIKRLHQIENQQAGLGMYTKPDVQKSLKLTDDQKAKIETIESDYRKELRDLSPGGGGGFGGGRGGFGGGGRADPQLAKKQEALKKEAIEKVMEVLDNDQRSGLKELTGGPFELQRAAVNFGGAGGGGGFGGAMSFGRPGQILAPGLQDSLKLTEAQKKQVEELQKETEAKLQKILTDEQNKQLKDIRDRVPGRGGFGGRGPGGAGGPGGDNR
jgi:hypothetical protein